MSLEELSIDGGYFEPIRAFLESPEGEGPFPTIIICHGLTANPIYPIDKHPIYKKLSEGLVANGFLTVRFNFTMNLEKDISTFHIDSEVHDLKIVLKYLLEDSRVNKKKIGTVGYSLGATILLMNGYKEKDIKAIVALAPKLELGDDYSDDPVHQEALQKGFFTHVDNKNTEWKISIDFWENIFKNGHNKNLKNSIRKLKQPLLLVCGESDNEDKGEAEAIQTLAKHAILECVEGTDHNFSNDYSINYAVRKAIEFFNQKL